MRVVSFRYYGRFGHFLRAESNVNWLTYPVPTRTVLLGLLGAILGLKKDTPQKLLADAHIAVKGKQPKTYWHKANIRQQLPAPLPLKINKTSKGSSSASKNAKQIPQEWLFHPDYTIYVALSDDYQEELEGRLKDRRYYYSPSLGLSEMIAQLEFLNIGEAQRLPEGSYFVDTVVSLDDAQLDDEKIFKESLAIRSLRMPYSVTEERVFTMKSYVLEHEARPIPVRTDNAWQFGSQILMFL